MKNKIFIKQWLRLKPVKYNGRSDLYYLKIANNIFFSFDQRQKLMLLQFMDDDDILDLCCFLTCYFEDVISETNVWKSFKSLYAEAYDKKLPFYQLNEAYMDDEINLEDVAFLIWYYCNTIQTDMFSSPHNAFLFEIANQVMDVLDDEYEFAPENEALKKVYQFDLNSVANQDRFYAVRRFSQTVFFDSYLFYPDVRRLLDEAVIDVVEELTEEESNNPGIFIREMTEEFTFNKCSALLALNAKDWTAKLLELSKNDDETISSISQKIKGFFLYKSQSETDVTLEHIASGKVFNMTKKSFKNLQDIKEDFINYIGLVKYDGEWWFSGNFMAQPFDADLILDQKNSVTARAEVNFLEDDADLESITDKQKRAFMDYNNGSLIAFLDAQELNTFVTGFGEFFNTSLNLTNEAIAAAHERTKADGYFGKTDGFDGFDNDDEPVVVFFNPNSGLEFYNDVVNAFPDEQNPFYVEESKEDIIHILMSGECSTEFTNYFVEHYKDKLEIFKNDPYKSYLEDLDFLLKFWKKDNYKTINTTVLTGKLSNG